MGHSLIQLWGHNRVRENTSRQRLIYAKRLNTPVLQQRRVVRALAGVLVHALANQRGHVVRPVAVGAVGQHSQRLAEAVHVRAAVGDDGVLVVAGELGRDEATRALT
jgi:hypothetical protein